MWPFNHLPSASGIGPITLVPPTKCLHCMGTVYVRTEKSWCMCYTTDGPIPATSFKGICKSCDLRYWYDHYKDGDNTYYFQPEDGRFFMSSSEIVFSLKMLERIHIQLSRGTKPTFLNISEMYNAEYEVAATNLSQNFSKAAPNKKRKSNDDLIIAAWVLDAGQVRDAWYR